MRLCIGLLVLVMAPSLALAKSAPQCTKRSLPIAQSMPALKYDCPKDTPRLDLIVHPSRTNALDRYAHSLERWATAKTWDTSVEEINACRVKKQLGQLTTDELDEFSYTAWGLQESGGRRLVVQGDPCLPAGVSSMPLVAMLLSRSGDHSTPSMLHDRLYSKNAYAPASLRATTDDSGVILLESFSGGLRPSCSYYLFQMHGHEAKPHFILRTGLGTVSAISSPCDMEAWHAKGQPEPEFIRAGTLRAHVSLYDTEWTGNEPKLVRRQLERHGKQLVLNGYATDAKALGQCRAHLKTAFDPKTPPSCAEHFPCEEHNDLAWLYFKSGDNDQAMYHAGAALDHCRFSTEKEQKAAAYNFKKIHKARK